MKAKWIRVHIRRKVDAWLDSITDTQLRSDLSDKVIVTGGCIASMLLGDKVNDFDVYFRDKLIARRVADYYIAQWNEAQTVKHAERLKASEGKRGRPPAVPVPVYIKDREDGGWKIYVKSAGIVGENNDEDYAYFEGVDPLSGQQDNFLDAATDLADDVETESDLPAYRPVFLSANAISLHGRVQLIFRFHGEPEQIHENYDFVHCTNYWTSWDGLHLKQEALEALLAKELRYVGSKYPICSVFRVRKFLDRGWTVTAGQLFKICHQISKLDLSNYATLEDQLIGVDSAYFSQVLAALRKGKDEGDNTVDETYLINLIDKVF